MHSLNSIQNKLNQLEKKVSKTSKPFTFKQACAYLGVSKSWLYNLTMRKVIPYYKPNGKLIYFKESDLDDWIFKNGIYKEHKIITDHSNGDQYD